jgi:hypothetical protein
LGKINLLSGTTLTLTQPSQIEGSVIVNSPNQSGVSTLAIETFNGLPLAVSGSGQIVLSGSSANLPLATLSAPGNAPASWGPNFVIRGIGRITGSHIVRGRIITDVLGGAIDLDGATMLGEGTGRIEAQQGDIFVSDNALLGGFLMTANPGSRFRFNGANSNFTTVSVSNCVINGVSSLETGTLNLTNSEINGSIVVNANSALRLRGNALTLNGSCIISPVNSFSTAGVLFDDAVVVGGTGDFLLQQSTTEPLAFSGVNNLPVTLGSGIRVRGRGRIGGDFNLAGSIVADDPFRSVLEVRGATINGLGSTARLSATTGVLALSDCDINNADIDINPASELRIGVSGFASQIFNDVSITGPVVLIGGVSVFNRSVINGSLTIRPGIRATATIMPFGLTGDMRINDNFSNTATSFTFEQSGIMTGSGRVLLKGNPQSTNTALFATTANSQVVLPSSISVQGLGTITGRFEIGGEFVADDAFGGELGVRGSTITGRPGARMRATTGDLVIADGTILTGVPLISEGGLVRIFTSNFGNTTTLNQLSISGRARFETGTVNLNEVPMSGSLEIRSAATVRVLGTEQEINGELRLNPLSAFSAASLTFDQTASLVGAADVRLVAPPLSPEFALVTGPSNGILTVGPDITIAGAGRVTGRINLGGVLRADDPLRGILEVRSPSLLRTGTGRLEIIDANLGIVESVVSGVPIAGLGLGELRTFSATSNTTQLLNLLVDARFVASSGVTVVSNAVVKRGIDIRPGAVVRVVGSPFACDGNLTVNSFGSSTASTLQFDQSTTLSGTGTLLLSSNALAVDTALVTLPSATSRLVLPASRALAGSGRIGGAVTVGGDINPFSPIQAFPVGQIEFSGSECKMQPSTVFRVDVVDAFGFDRLSGAAAKRLDGELLISLPTGFYPAPSDRYAVVTGNQVTGQFFKVTPPPGYQAEVEYEADAAYVRLAKLCPGDMDANGVVDDLDFQYFAASYNVLACADPDMPLAPADRLPNRCFADMTRDGVVHDDDFALFVGAYDTVVCP